MRVGLRYYVFQSRRDVTICSPARKCRVTQPKKFESRRDGTMANSYVSNHVHIVFSTKNRTRMINEELQPKLWAYMAGILKNHGMRAIAIGGIEEHVPPLINLWAKFVIPKTRQVLKDN